MLMLEIAEMQHECQAQQVYCCGQTDRQEWAGMQIALLPPVTVSEEHPLLC